MPRALKKKPTQALPAGQWLTRAEAAVYLGVGRNTFRVMLREGVLVPDGAVGARPRFLRASLDAFIRAKKPPSRHPCTPAQAERARAAKVPRAQAA